jgi:hypothetical protein
MIALTISLGMGLVWLVCVWLVWRAERRRQAADDLRWALRTHQAWEA